MLVSSTGARLRFRLLALLQAALIVGTLAAPLSVFAAATVTSATVNGGSATTVAPSASITGSLTVTLTGGTRWRSTGWRIATTSGAYTCASTTAHTTNGTYTESFAITAPAAAGTYNVYFAVFSNAGCGGGSVTTTSLANAVVVQSKLDQTIAFGPLSDKRPDQMPVTVSATATSSLPVTFTSATPTVCTVSGSTVNHVSNGTCTIDANQAGDATYNAAPQVSQSFAIGPANQAITFGTLSDKAVTDPDFTISATASSTLAVAFTSATPSVCTVAGDTVHLVAIGTCTIDANQAGNASWNPAPQVSQSFTVGKADTVTTVTCPAGPFTYDGTAQTPCTAEVAIPGFPPAPIAVFYTANTNAGTATASASFAGSSSYNPSSDSTTFVIGKADPVCAITGWTGTYDGSAHGASGTCVGVDGTTVLAGLDLGASFTDVPGGTADWTFTDASGNYNDDSGSVAIVIAGMDTVTTVTCPAGPFTYDGTAQTPCTAEVAIPGFPPAPIAVFYTANTNAGTATASASFAGSSSYNPSSDSTTFVIGKADPVCAITGWTGTYDGSAHGASGTCVGVDGTTVLAGLDLGASFTDVPGGTADWTFTDASGNYNDDSGSVAIVIAGMDTVTTVTCPAGPFTYDGTAQTPCTAEVAIPGFPPAPIAVFYTANTNAGTATASASFAGSSSYNPSSDSTTFVIGKATSTTVVACPVSVSYTGSALEPCSVAVTGVGGLSLTPDPVYADNTDAGTATASYTFAGDANHLGSTDSTEFEIGRAPADCTVTGWTGTYDGEAHGATGSCTGVGGTPLAGLDLGASFTDVPGGAADWLFANRNYFADSGSVDIDISAATQAIDFPPMPNVEEGATGVVLGATTDSGLPVTYTSLTPDVCTVSGTTVTIVGTGTCSIEASQAGDANHGPAQAVTQSFRVLPADSSTPETSTASPFVVLGGSPSIPPGLYLVTLAAGILAGTLMLLGIRARRDEPVRGASGR